MMPVQSTSRPGAVDSGRAAQEAVRRNRVNGGAPGKAVRMPGLGRKELRVLEARMDMLNAMLQDLVSQVSRIQMSDKPEAELRYFDATLAVPVPGTT